MIVLRAWRSTQCGRVIDGYRAGVLSNLGRAYLWQRGPVLFTPRRNPGTLMWKRR